VRMRFRPSKDPATELHFRKQRDEEHAEQGPMLWQHPGLRVVLRWTLPGLVAVALLTVLVDYLLTDRSAWGVVSAPEQAYRSPDRLQVQGVYVQAGDEVDAGELLCVLRSPADQAELTALRRELIRLRDLHQRLLDGDPQARAEAEALIDPEHIAALEADLESLLQAHRAADATRDKDLEARKLRLYQAQSDYLAAKERSEKVGLLNELEAAIGSDLKRAQTAERDALYELERSRLALAEGEQQTADARSSAQLAREQLEQAIDRARGLDLDVLAQRIAELENELARRSEALQPLELRAHHRGVVTGLSVADGDLVAADGPLLQIAATEQLWVDTYLSAEAASAITDGSSATVASEGGRSGRGGMERSVPAEVHRRNGLERGVLLRVDLTEPGQLLPGTLARVAFD